MKQDATIQKTRRILYLLAMIGAMSAQAANPADWKTFTSATKRNWSDATSWTAGTGVPTSGTSLVVNFDPSKAGTVTSSGKIGNSFDTTNNLGTVELNALNLAGESSGSGRTIRVFNGSFLFSGDAPAISDTTAGVADSIKYQFYSSLLMDADLNLNLNGTGELTLLLGTASTLSANSAGLKTLTATGAGKCNLGSTSTTVISDGAGQLGITMAGTGTLTLGGANTFTGGILIKSGTIRKNSGSPGVVNAFGAGTIRLGDTSGNSGATLEYTALGSGATFANPVTVQAGSSGTKTIINSADNMIVTLGGLLTLNDDVIVTYPSTATGYIKLGTSTTAEAMTGTGDISFFSNGTSAHQILGNNVNFTDDVIIHTGTTLVNSDTALNASNTVAVASGAAFNINNKNQTIAGLSNVSGAGGVVTQTGANLKTLTLGGNGTYSFDGSIGATTPANLALTVALTGNGTQTLGGVSSYTGATTVNGGTLLVNGSLAADSAMTVGPNGTLGGSGTVNGSATINGTLAPGGAGIGTLTLGSTVIFAENAKYAWGFQNGTGDVVSVTGNLQLPAAATVDVTEGAGARLDPGVLFEAGSLSGASNLSSWTVSPDGYSVAIEGTSVLLLPPPDPRTVIIVK